MEYTTLGDTGLAISRIGLGCASFGLDSSARSTWSLGEDESREIIERAIELGINFFDTANSYSWGDSERVLGSVLGDYDRDEFVVASKVYHHPSENPHPNAVRLSRKAIEQELENSLERLDMETLDLYQTHRWDYDTPIEVTLRALDDAVRRGKVRYIGASSMWTYQFADSLHTADRLGTERFATMHNHYNLVYREEEREMLPYCLEQGVGVIPWSPLARGYLARPHDEFETTPRGRSESTKWERRHAIYRDGGGREINARVQELADEKGASMAQIALAWHLHTPWVDAPIVGTSSLDHLEEAVGALEIGFSDDEMAYLEEPYEPVAVTGPD